MIDLHINRQKKAQILPEDVCGDKFYKSLFPIRFELSVPQHHETEEWQKDFTVYMSTNCQEPNDSRFQKLAKGKKMFLYDLKDYFE